jgi:hypothetical protein
MAFKVKYTDTTESHLDRDLAGSLKSKIHFTESHTDCDSASSFKSKIHFTESHPDCDSAGSFKSENYFTESHPDCDLAGSVEAGIHFTKMSPRRLEHYYWEKPIQQPRVGARTLTLDSLNTWEYTMFRPMGSNPGSRNIERVASLAHPILRAALPALGNGAPDHLGYEVRYHMLPLLPLLFSPPYPMSRL